MGKWMTSYREELLHNKLADLIGGAVKRSCLEPDEDPINLDSVVEDLDPGDSFVTTIVDILVKELADRRTREEEDRRCISERTSRTLRQLSASRCVPSRRVRARSEFLDPLPYELGLDDDDDDLGTYLEHSSFAALSDAFIRDSSTPSLIQPLSRSLPPLSSGSSQALSVSMPMSSLAARALPPLRSTSRRFPRVTESSSSLTRQNSLRRTGRARTTDFHDFTSRRRSAAREDADEHSQDTRTNHAWNSTDPEFIQESASRAPSHPLRRREISDVFPLDTLDPTAPFPSLSDVHPRSDSTRDPHILREPVLPPFSWFGPEDDIPRMLNDEDALPRFFSEPHDIGLPISSSAPSPVPRLRRGGLRAPEVIATEQVHTYLATERGN